MRTYARGVCAHTLRSSGFGLLGDLRHSTKRNVSTMSHMTLPTMSSLKAFPKSWSSGYCLNGVADHAMPGPQPYLSPLSVRSAPLSTRARVLEQTYEHVKSDGGCAGTAVTKEAGQDGVLLYTRGT